MKKIVGSLIFLALGTNAHALNLVCKDVAHFSDDEIGTNKHLLVGRVNAWECRTNKNETVYAFLIGVGPGLSLDAGSVLNISCPLISHKKLMKRISENKAITVFGPEVEAGALLGIKTGFLINHRGGICTLAGAGIGLGASASIAGLTIGLPDSPHQGPQRTGSALERALRIFEW